MLAQFETYCEQNKYCSPYNTDSYPYQVYNSPATFHHKNTKLRKETSSGRPNLTNDYPSNIQDPYCSVSSNKKPKKDSVTPPSGQTIKEKVLRTPKPEFYSDSLEIFRSPEIGGVAIALTHGSVILK